MARIKSLASHAATPFFVSALVSVVLLAPVVAQEIDYSHPAYEAIEREPAQENQHTDGQVAYGTPFPTSGFMNPRPTVAGFYEEELRREPLVHSLEHGHIVIYYDEPGDEALTVLRGWTDSYQGQLDGVIAVRNPGLGEGIVLTAWERRLQLDRLDSRAALFIDAFRGRGPEQKVR